ncbi:hypothetical protein SUDANB58_01487 [Streptomyces sp. enrichment culture]|uniref:hypothetical protein n=1 Tax=Streptomyces sp. enrichment culture TaxID=1795815 RepID=UPI003F556F05
MNTERPDHDDAGAGAEAVPGTSGPTGAVPAGSRAPAGTGAGRGRPARRRSAVVASVAAAVLLVGGGGAYLAAGPPGPDRPAAAGGSGGAPPPLALDGPPAPADGGPPGIAPGEPDPRGVVHLARGALPRGPGSAPVYRAEGEVTRDEVARLAKALGVEGTPVTRGRAWTVGTAGDGMGPFLRVERRAPGDWAFHRYAPGTDDCAGTAACAEDPGAPAGGLVSEAEATRAAAPVLAAAGWRDVSWDAGQVLGGRRVVTAEPRVGGLPTYGWTTGLTVGAGGEVTGGSGRLKAPVKGDVYPVLTARKALALLNAAPAAGARGGIGGCAGPVPLEGDPRTAACGPSARKGTATVERAVFGLAAHSVRGRPALVPSWLFEVRAPGARDASTVVYPAVDPAYLAPAGPTRGPSGEPAPAPSVRDVEVESYTAEGTELTVGFTGGVCAAYEAEAAESGDEVRVTVTETSQPEEVCVLIAEEHHLTVRLEEPLGGRRVVGSDGGEIPLERKGARLPVPSGAR